MSPAIFASHLNTPQLEAVTYCDGPSLVVAGAGSGKTRVLTYKIAYLLQNGYEPWSLLALTFTNKAAREMNGRIAEICGGADLRGLWSGTFHSLFARLLRIENAAAGYPADYTIYDTSDSRSLLKSIAKELQLDEKIYKPATMAGRISEAKNHLMLPAQYVSDKSVSGRDQVDGLGEMGEIYRIYQQRLRAASAMDFDDLLLNTFLLLRDNPEVRERYKHRFRYILVDEYQDTNIAQHQILKLLTDPDSRICVVGDDAQSIYGFRGADISNILNFQKQYPSARVIKLERNYRSTQNIVDAANSIIRHNRSQIPKKVFSSGGMGDRIQVFSAQTDKEEAKKVAMRVVSLHRRQVPYDGIALLYRTNAQSRAFEEAFQNANIPYQIYGGLSFYQRKEIKDVMAYLRLIANPNDEEAFRRIINYPARGIGSTTQQKIYLTAAENAVSPWQVACDMEKYGLQARGVSARKIDGFCQLIKSFRVMAEKQSAHDVARAVVRQSGIGADICSGHDAESMSRQENVEELLGSIRLFEQEKSEEQGINSVSIAEYLSTVSLLTDTDQRTDGTPRVTLMTVHAAKGLEFEAVFVTGMEEELFPNANAFLYPKEMEEERRLFYVAVTRANNFCFLSYARSRYRYGNFQFCEPSPFIDEIDEKYLERTDSNMSSATSFHEPYRSVHALETSQNGKILTGFSSPPFYRHPTYRTADSAASCHSRSLNSLHTTSISHKEKSSLQPNGLSVGVRINHERFGEGVIVGLEGSGDSAKVRVDFGQGGVKNLLVKYAKITVIGH